MVEIVFGMWIMYGLMLFIMLEEWLLCLFVDYVNKVYWYQIGCYDFDMLVEMCCGEGLVEKSLFGEWIKCNVVCCVVIDEMVEVYVVVKFDVVIIFGNDQQELFNEMLMFVFIVFNGEKVWNELLLDLQVVKYLLGIYVVELGYKLVIYIEYFGYFELVNYLIGDFVRNQFDIMCVNSLLWLDNYWYSGIGYVFGFVYCQIMCDQVVLYVLFIINIFFLLNQLIVWCCFEMGCIVGRVIKVWKLDVCVVIFGLGGMLYFVIDEVFDQQIFVVLVVCDVEVLCMIGEDWL